MVVNNLVQILEELGFFKHLITICSTDFILSHLNLSANLSIIILK